MHLKTWCLLFGDFCMDSTMVNHHVSPSFGGMFLVFSHHQTSTSKKMEFGTLSKVIGVCALIFFLIVFGVLFPNLTLEIWVCLYQ